MRDSNTDSSESPGPSLSRRTFVSAAVASGAILATSSWATGSADARLVFRDRPFDDKWRFQRGDVAGAERFDFDDATWRELDLPHDWSIEDLPGNSAQAGNWTAPVAVWNEDLQSTAKSDEIALPQKPKKYDTNAPLRVGPFDAEGSPGRFSTGWTVGGTGWYRKRFGTIEVPDDGQVELRFDGAYCETEVWLNGFLAGQHVNGYSSFAVDLTPHWRSDGKNVLAVRVRNLGDNSRWYAGSGIYRHVWLTVTGPVRLPLWGISVATPTVTSDEARVRVAVEVENRRAASQLAVVRAEIFDFADRRVVWGEQPVSLAAHGSAKAEFELQLRQPALWSPDHSTLYRAQATLVMNENRVDMVNTRFGVRSVEIDAKHGLLINGESFKLKGACVHHDNGLLGAMAIDRAEIHKVELLKSNGFNAIRCSHNLYSPLFLATCDELGMLVIDETFDAWEQHKVPDDYAKHFTAHWRADIGAMVRRDRNHPCVILWSLGNEIPEKNTPRGVEIAEMLREEILRHDPTRPITAAIDQTSGDAGEPARRHLDIAGYNYLASAYEADHAANPDLILYGSEQFARDLYMAWSQVERHPYVIGDFVWTGIEYLGETCAGGSQLRTASDDTSQAPTSNCERNYPTFRAGCGELDFIGLKKPQSHYRDVLWRRSALEVFVQRPIPPGMMVAMDDWAWHDELASWTWPEFQNRPMTVRVYTRSEEVHLLLNQKEVGRKRLTPNDQLKAEFTVSYAPGELTAIVFSGGAEDARKSLVTVGAPAQLRLRTSRLPITGSRNDLAYIYAEVLDSEGRLVPDAAVPVKFALRGSAEFAGVGAANPRSVESFRDNRCRTFHGVALAIVRPLGRAGRASLRVQSHHLKEDEINIEMHLI